ncbi:MAG: hypothetical protein ACTSWX_01110 [Promethearchaeota archaeon]
MNKSKNLNLKVPESLFYDFHRLKASLKAETNQDCLKKLIIIADQNLTGLSKNERDKFLQNLQQ